MVAGADPLTGARVSQSASSLAVQERVPHPVLVISKVVDPLVLATPLVAGKTVSIGTVLAA
jgi:uncharacterized membrane protein YczE